MICRLLRLCYVLDRYRAPIEAYINGVRGDALKNICIGVFMGDGLLFPRGDNSEIFDLIDQVNWHVWDVEEFFKDKVSFAGMLP